MLNILSGIPFQEDNFVNSVHHPGEHVVIIRNTNTCTCHGKTVVSDSNAGGRQTTGK